MMIMTHVLDALCEAVVADVALPFFLFCVVEPFHAFMQEPAKDFVPHEISDGRPPSCAAVRDDSRVAEEPAQQVERR